MTATQAVAFPRDAWTLAAAKAWLRDHDYTVGTPEHTRNFWKFGQEDPDRFDRFATKRIEADSGSINLILGVRSNPLTTSELQRLEPATVKTRRAYAIPPRRSLAFGRDVLAIAKTWGYQADLGGDLAPMVEILGPAVRGVWTISAPAWAHDEIRQAARSRGGREQSQTTRRAMRPPQTRPEPETLLLFNPDASKLRRGDPLNVLPPGHGWPLYAFVISASGDNVRVKWEKAKNLNTDQRSRSPGLSCSMMISTIPIRRSRRSGSRTRRGLNGLIRARCHYLTLRDTREAGARHNSG